ncbi:unnamed protein product, partial [marine sediment metagenome]
DIIDGVVDSILTETESHPTLVEIEASAVLTLKAHLVHGTGDIIPPDNKGIWDYLPFLDSAISGRAPANEYNTEMGRITGNVALASILEDAMQKATSPAYNQDTDSLEALREAIDGISGGATAQQVWEYGTRRLTNLDDTRASYIDQLDFDLQAKLLEIDAEVEGLAGAAMRGTNSSQLASTALTQYNAIIAGQGGGGAVSIEATDDLIISDDGVENDNSTSYVKQKEFRVLINGVWRIKWDMRCTEYQKNVWVMLYKNGISTGLESSRY